MGPKELWVVRSPCGTVLGRREFGLWIDRNRMDCEAMCSSLCWNDCEVFKCDMCIPFPLYVYDVTCVCKGDVLAKDFSRVLNE